LIFIFINFIALNQARAMSRYFEGVSELNNSKQSWYLLFKIILFGKKLSRKTSIENPADYGLKYSEHKISSGNGVEICFWCIPNMESKKVVILCHGHKKNKSYVLNEANFFWNQGYTCFLIDFRGAGNSNKSYNTAGYLEALDLKALDQYVNCNFEFEEKVYFGHSMGAIAIFRAISDLSLRPDRIIVEAVYKSLLETLKSRVRLLGLPAFPLAHMIVFWWSMIHRKSGLEMDLNRFAKNMKIPILMLHGENDSKAELQHAREGFDSLQGEVKKFVIMPGLIHESYLDKMEVLWTKEVISFLKNKGH
jgi:alpha-beta hydrolase superfamily lysophospholipase